MCATATIASTTESDLPFSTRLLIFFCYNLKYLFVFIEQKPIIGHWQHSGNLIIPIYGGDSPPHLSHFATEEYIGLPFTVCKVEHVKSIWQFPHYWYAWCISAHWYGDKQSIHFLSFISCAQIVLRKAENLNEKHVFL